MGRIFRDIIYGVGSILDIAGAGAGRYRPPQSAGEGFARDAEALAADWAVVGQDVRDAMHCMDREGDLAPAKA